MPPDREMDEKNANASSVLVDEATLAGGQEVNMDQRDLPVDKEKQQQRLSLAQGEEGTVYLSDIKLLLVMASLTVVLVLTMLDISIVGTAIPQITSDFHRLEDVGWYIGSYQLASATIQPLTGKMYTYFSTKWIYLFFFLIFEIGSAVCGAATSSGMLIGGRSIAGAGQSGLMNGSLIVVLGICRPEIRPMYTGFAMGMGQLGVILGPLLGGILTEHASWRWCFYINLPLGAVAGLFLILIDIPEQTFKQRPTLPYIRSLLPHFDLSGFALFAVASVMFLLALQFGSSADYRWNSSTVIGLLCGAVVAAVLFALWERHMGADAMIPGRMVSQTVVWTSALHFALLMSSLVVGGNFLPIYLQSVKGLTPTMSGVYMLGSIIPQLIFILISGALVQRLGYYLPWAVGATALTAIGAGLISTWGPWTGLGALLGYQVLFGARGAGMQMPIVAIQHHLPAKETAIGSSFIVFCQNFLNAIFITVGSTIFQDSLAKGVSAHVPSGIVSPEDAVAAGGSAAAVRALAPPGPIRDGLLRAYSDSFGDVMYLIVATCACGSVVALGMGWTDLRVKKELEEDTSTNASST